MNSLERDKIIEEISKEIKEVIRQREKNALALKSKEIEKDRSVYCSEWEKF